MQKVYSRINWENDPSINTPLNEDNLNQMDYALDKIDDRVVHLAGYEERVKISEENAKTSEDNAKESELKAKEYAEQAQESAENVGDLIVPKGDITFEELSTFSAKTGYMYKIINDFYSDETFADGGGKFYLAGTKVYMNKDGLWELLTSTSGDAAGASDIAIPLLIDNWVFDEENGEYVQTVSISGLREESSPLIVPSPVGDSLTDEELSAYNCLKNDIHIEVGLITFRAYKIPSISFTVIAKGASATGDAVATVTALVAKVSELEAEVDANASTITKLNSDLNDFISFAIGENDSDLITAGNIHFVKNNKNLLISSTSCHINIPNMQGNEVIKLSDWTKDINLAIECTIPIFVTNIGFSNVMLLLRNDGVFLHALIPVSATGAWINVNANVLVLL